VTPPPLAQADAARLAIFLDFDGCLVDLAPRPQDVVVPRTCRRSCTGSGGGRGGRWRWCRAVPSRSFAVSAGPGPAALRQSRGRAVGARGADARLAIDVGALAEAARRAEAELMAQPGLLLERKPVGLGLHYRGAPSRRRRSATCRPASSGLPGYHAHHGKMVVELRPDGIGKGNAVRT
jgi:trehalose 6-phosphate phosphatase